MVCSRERGEVGNAVIHADGCGESKTLDRSQIAREDSNGSIESSKNSPFETFTPLTDLFHTAPVPCSMSLSPSRQMSRTLAPSTHRGRIFFTALLTISAAN